MAKFKSLNKRSKIFIFKSYDNEKQETPAKIIFRQFPFGMETYADYAIEGEKKISVKKIDFKAFFEECVERLEDFECDGCRIVTVNDFWQILPSTSAATIASEAYAYAMGKEEMTAGE